MKQFDFSEQFKEKIFDTPSGPKCTCDICGRKGKIGAFSFDRASREPLIICYHYELKIMAEREGISLKEAEKRRKRKFEIQYLFSEIKLAEYVQQKRKKDFDSHEEANLALARIVAAWNNLTTEERKSFEKINDQELRKIYNEIKVDFSGL